MAKKLDSRQIAYLLTQKIHELAKQYAKLNGMRDDLCGSCCIVGVPLWHAMTVFGLEAELKHGKTVEIDGVVYNHCWISFGGLVYDATFLQFNKNIPFYIGCPTKYHRVFTNKKDIISFAEFSNWIDDQQPSLNSTRWFVSRLLENFNIAYKERVKT